MDAHAKEQFKSLLEKERDTLTNELKSIAKPDPRMKGNWATNYPQFEQDSTGVGRNLDEEMNEVEEYEAQLAVAHSLESRLLTVSKALARIQQGNYGVCPACRKKIPRERLAANPAAEYHVEHEPKE